MMLFGSWFWCGCCWCLRCGSWFVGFVCGLLVGGRRLFGFGVGCMLWSCIGVGWLLVGVI